MRVPEAPMGDDRWAGWTAGPPGAPPAPAAPGAVPGWGAPSRSGEPFVPPAAFASGTLPSAEGGAEAGGEGATETGSSSGETGTTASVDFLVGFKDTSEYTLLIAKRDPGQGVIWLAFGLLIAGLAITFYFPRRRVWARLSPAGELAIVARADRYVDVEREFGRLLDDLVAVRRPDTP
jgi:hypothetical protein